MNWLLLKNSLLVASLATLLATAFGLCSALWLACLPPRWRARFLGVAVMALALPPFLVTNCWLHFLGNAGAWRGWLPFNILSLGGAAWILSLLLWPISLFAAGSAWRRLEPALLESDMALTGWPLIRSLLWPLARPALLQAAVLTFVLALNNFAVPALLQLPVYPAQVWIRFNTAFDTVGALRLSLPLVMAPLLLLLWFGRRELSWPHLELPVSGRLFRRQLGGLGFGLCALGSCLVMFLSVGLPLLQILSLRRTWTELPGALAAGRSDVWNSFWLAGLSASAVVVVGLWWALRKNGADGNSSRETARSRGFHSWFALLLWLPFFLPGVLLGIGLIACFNHGWSAFFYQSAGIVVLAFVVRYLAPGSFAVGRAVRGSDPDLADAARLEGADRWQMFRYVYWPQIAPAAMAAWYVIFLLCLWDVESMLLIVPPGRGTLALRIFNLLHYGYNAQVNALCLTLLALAVSPLVLWRVGSAASAAARRMSRPAGMLLSVLGWFALCGCSPPASSSDAALSSKLFSRVTAVGSRGVGVGQLNKPRSVAVDFKDNLYVVDMTGRVQKFSPAGAFELLWQMPQTDLGRPKGMGRDRAGNIIVVEPHYQRLNFFSPAGQLLAQWGQRGTNVGQFMMPRAVAVNSHGDVFVSEYGVVERVQKFSFSGDDHVPKCVLSFGKPGNSPGEFNRPEGLAMDAQDRLYVADSCNHRIQIFSSDGKFLRAHGRAGTGPGEFSYPYDICVDREGRQYVCEFGNSRVQVFDADDHPVETLGGPGAELGSFSNPWSLALDSAGNLYVADSQNHRVQKFVRRGAGGS